MNKATIIGNLTKDPELRTTQGGVNVCSFTVAVNRPKKPDGTDGGADYFRVSAWRGLGDTCAKYLQKGKKVCVIGPVSVTTNESNGKTYANLNITADDIEFLTPRGEQTDQQTGYTKVNDPDCPY